MLLTKFTDLGLRILLYLTHQERDLPVTIGEIARQFEVPHNHLIKVVNRLGKLGWIQATRGRTGGLKLSVNPASLMLGDVIAQLEGHTELINCAAQPCALHGNCLLKSALDDGLRAFYQQMNRYSLTDVTKNPTGEIIIRMHHQFVGGASVPVSPLSS
ncbi:RrF2 family transcriptional regulator [Leeia oryzae]|uniref:RrF2 family transcriptional regulator n=1 Tax=Leeia oryzae TaxID=356662 RepID=UPI00036FFC9E|nr:Rrf2 family transcriptional regulator [Leeia oryzae]